MKQAGISKSRDYLARCAASALLMLTMALSGTALAQENEYNAYDNNTNIYGNQNGITGEEYEYEADEGLHEEEWYDPSDWFDSGEGVSYESDWNDYYYGYDDKDGWNDDEYYSYEPAYGEDYGYNEEYGVGPAYGDQYDSLNEPTTSEVPNDYYTEDWYDDNSDSWLFE